MERISLLKILLEIGELTPNTYAFPKTFRKGNKDNYVAYFNDFEDDEYNKIQVSFTLFPKGELKGIEKNTYNIGFNVNGQHNTKALEKKDAKYYVRLISTLVKIILEFVKQFKPESILVLGDDIIDKRAEKKNAIYYQYLKRNIPSNYGWTELGNLEALYIYKRSLKEQKSRDMTKELIEYIRNGK